MEWKTYFKENEQVQYEWVETNQTLGIFIDIKKCTEEHKHRNRDMDYRLHCYGPLWEVQTKVPLPDEVIPYDKHRTALCSNDLGALIEISLIIKQMIEER